MKRKPVFIGKSWTIEVGVERVGYHKQVIGYATEARSATTHKFILSKQAPTFRTKTVELFSIPFSEDAAPNYIRIAVGKLLRVKQ